MPIDVDARRTIGDAIKRPGFRGPSEAYLLAFAGVMALAIGTYRLGNFSFDRVHLVALGLIGIGVALIFVAPLASRRVATALEAGSTPWLHRRTTISRAIVAVLTGSVGVVLAVVALLYVLER